VFSLNDENGSVSDLSDSTGSQEGSLRALLEFHYFLLLY
jgi:hypothetical protein